MSVVTIAGQAGSGHTEFAEKVAKSMNYKLIDDAVFTTVLKEYGIVDTQGLLNTPPNILEIFDAFGKERHDAINLLNRIYLAFAKQGNVVIASDRAYLVLHDYMNVLNIFLESPSEDRIKNVIAKQGGTKEEAEKIVEHDENVRIKLIESFYNEKWDSFLPFSLVINTHSIGLDLAENIVKEATGRLGKDEDHFKIQQNGNYNQIDSIEVDSVLQSFIMDLLENM